MKHIMQELDIGGSKLPVGYVNIPRSMIKEQSCKANEPPKLLYIMFQKEY